MTRSVAIPAGATTAYLRFDHAYGFEDNGATAYDGGVLEISTNGGGSFTDIGALLTDVRLQRHAIATGLEQPARRPARVRRARATATARAAPR